MCILTYIRRLIIATYSLIFDKIHFECNPTNPYKIKHVLSLLGIDSTCFQWTSQFVVTDVKTKYGGVRRTGELLDRQPIVVVNVFLFLEGGMLVKASYPC